MNHGKKNQGKTFRIGFDAFIEIKKTYRRSIRRRRQALPGACRPGRVGAGERGVGLQAWQVGVRGAQVLLQLPTRRLTVHGRVGWEQLLVNLQSNTVCKKKTTTTK